jgi:hypothetical protein
VSLDLSLVPKGRIEKMLRDGQLSHAHLVELQELVKALMLAYDNNHDSPALAPDSYVRRMLARALETK